MLLIAILNAAFVAAAAAQTLRTDSYVADGPVYATALSGNTLYIGGNFTHVFPVSGGSAVPRNGLAALDVTSGALKPWNPNPSAGITALAISGTTAYVGGWFTYIGGQPRDFLAAVDAVTGEVKAWNAGSVLQSQGQPVYALAASPTTVYVAGDFLEIGGQNRLGLAAMDATTGQLTAWNPSVFGEVRALVVSESTVYAAGDFWNIAGATRYDLAALNATTGAATPWSPNADGWVAALAVRGNTVYAGGYFSVIGGEPRHHIAALDAASGHATTWSPDPDSWASSLAVSEAAVYVGGSFTRIGGQPRNRLAALDPGSGMATIWDPNANGEVFELAVGGGGVFAGGEFTQMQGLPRGYLAAWEPEVTGVPEADPHEVGAQLASGPNPFRDAARIRYRLPAPSDVSLRVFDVCGRPVATLIRGRTEPAGWHEVSLDGRNLATGIYFLTLQAGRESRTVKALRVE